MARKQNLFQLMRREVANIFNQALSTVRVTQSKGLKLLNELAFPVRRYFLLFVKSEKILRHFTELRRYQRVLGLAFYMDCFLLRMKALLSRNLFYHNREKNVFGHFSTAALYVPE